MEKYPVRTSAKAIIIYDNKVLFNKNEINEEIYYTLPGGGQNLNEDLYTAVKRECLEEVGAEVEVKDILFIRDYIANNHEFAEQNPNFHQLELMFECIILNYGNLYNPTELDSSQIDIEWIEITDLKDSNIYPRALKEELSKHINGENTKVYFGDVN